MTEVQLIDILDRQMYDMYCYTHTAVFHFKTWQYSLALTSVLCEDGGLAGGGGQLNHYLGVIYLAV